MKLKRLMSGLAAVSIAITSFSVPIWAEENTAAPEDHLFELTFDESGTGSGSYEASKGGTVTENGSVSYEAGKEGNALRIASKNANNYLRLPDGILSGKTAATYSFYYKPESDAAPNWPFMTTSLTTQEYNREKYVGMLAMTGTFTVERYNNSGSRLSSVTSSGNYSGWNYVSVVVDDSSTKLYVNGLLKASDDRPVDLSGVFTADSKTWIGHANWGSGEGFQGMVDEFKIYGRALSEEEVQALAGDAYINELKNIARKYNRVDIDTNFYKGADKVFGYNAGDTITVDTALSNKKTETVDLTVELSAYDANDAKIDGTSVSETYTGVGVLDSVEFSRDITTDAAAAYYKVTVTEGENSYDAGRVAPLGDVVFPAASPVDSAETTEGVHDPTIFKDPVSGKYYVYSSHNLVFESDDLINWVKKDYTQTVTIPAKAKAFIDANYSDTTANETYWAPDILYVEGDEYPYWFYLSCSCGLGGRNSVITLVKAKSPGLWDGDYTDEGVVLASMENANYNTNAIDANIYSENGVNYIFWGSFWKGIHAARLTADGKVEGVDYTSDATILSSCQKFGTRLFSTPSGIMGPEGAYTIHNDETGYTYMFTSYGWLGTNYNIRVARTDKSMADVMSSPSPHRMFVDYNNDPVGTTYAEQDDLTQVWGYKMSGSFKLGDGIEYLGSGHNSVIKADDGSWYLVQHCRKVADAVAYLQVKKMLWTDEGWPVVSPLVYAGEEEQIIPEAMLYGTWDLSSVGHLIFADGVTDVGSSAGAANNRGTDLPVHSSEMILQPDHTLAGGLGTWKYDGDHTVTLTFEKDGLDAYNQFYKAGNTMTLYALAGYDKDERESAIVMTGTDQNGITQFAKKNNAAAASTAKVITLNTTPIELEKSTNGNPILGFDADGNTVYAGDPAALVDGDTVYLYAGHDTSTGEYYNMPEWLCYSSKDMVNWTYEGVAMNANTISWRVNDTTAWASQAIKYNGKYYLYYCTTNKNANRYHSIGVAISDSPTGPFTDIGAPVVNGQTMTPENTNEWNDIDPTVWVETVDGVEHRYLAWGNTIFYVCELNEDMTSVKDISGDGKIDSSDVKRQTINNLPDGLGFTEAPWIYRRTDENGNYTGKYYMFGAFGWREQMGYATSDTMYGPWEFQAVLMPPTATSNTNHPSVIDFKGKTYFIYHNGSLSWGSGYRRVVCVEEFTFNEDGSIDPIQETSTGLTGTKSAISQNGMYFCYDDFVNPSEDASYPLTRYTNMDGTSASQKNAQWEIVQGLGDDGANYVSIQAVNKPGLYIKANADETISLTQDAKQNDTSTRKAMTFKTVAGLNGSEGSVSFESMLMPGYYLANYNGTMTLMSSVVIDTDACTFNVSKIEEPEETVKIVAKYDNGRLVSITTENIEYTEGMEIEPIENAKIFIWDSITGMKPICDAVTSVQ